MHNRLSPKKIDISEFNTTQLALLVMLAGTVVTAAATSNISTLMSAGGASVIYNVLAEGRDAVFGESYLIDSIEAKCGLQRANATLSNLTNPVTFFTKKFMRENSVSLQDFGMTPATNPSTAECLIKQTKAFIHAVKQANKGGSTSKFGEVFLYTLIGIFVLSIVVVAAIINKNKIMETVKPVTDAFRLTSSQQSSDIESQALTATDGAASEPARMGYGASR